MYRSVWRSGFYICSTIVAPNSVKTIEKSKEETGFDRILKVFQKDHYDDYSPEFSNMYQTTVFTCFFGAAYGGFIESREAYLNFIERNDATKFTSHLDAKRKLQDQVSLAFGRGALKYGIKIGMFGGFYVTTISLLGAYRGEQKLIDYIIGGLISGMIYRVNYGLNGIIVGGTLGTLVGLLAGICTTLILKITGRSYDDIYEAQKETHQKKNREVRKMTQMSYIDDESKKMLSDHDKSINVP